MYGNCFSLVMFRIIFHMLKVLKSLSKVILYLVKSDTQVQTDFKIFII